MKKKTDSENYQIFARKFRPQTFEEVIGQEPVTTTLKNAISKGRVAQSFLFTGSRGVGKTSTARIFAKALNCEKGPSPATCNQCSICIEITQGSDLDILEIDGASNNSVDEIRTLRENVKFKPARGRFKVYIIDEVHMLSTGAFNALLKTLEEPPEHVKFIFATTEVHKVPLTILSRCQRFNFRRIPTDEIAAKLKEIAKQEKIKVNDRALFVIAKSSEGSLRDAEGLLDQLASFGDGEVNESDINFSLGLTDSDVYFSLLESLRNKEAKAVISTLAGVAEQGKDLLQFTKGLIEIFRNILVLQVGSDTEKLIEGTEEQINQLKKLKNGFSREELLFSLTLLQQLFREIRWSDTPRFLAEACLLKIANRADLKAIDEILREVKSLRVNSAPEKGTSHKPAEAKNFAPETYSKNPEPVASHQKKKDNFELKQSEAVSLNEATRQSHSVILSAAPPKIGRIRPLAEKNLKDPSASPQDDISDKTASRNSSVTLIDVGRVWPELLERVKAVKMSCGTYLAESEPVEVTDGIVVFGLPAELKFHRDALDKQDNKDLVRSTLIKLLRRDAGVAFVVTRKTEPLPQIAASAKIRTDPSSGGRDSDIITSALNIFETGKVVHRDPV